MAAPSILLVDDDEHKRLLIAHYLTTKFPSATVHECRSGAEAIDQLNAQPIDAIITDHSMVPVDGIQLIKWARSKFSDLPIVMVSGHPDIREVALNAGANQVVSSLSFSEVGDVLEKLWLQRRSQVNPDELIREQ
jgi:CheY-like chemotaxis protein